MAVKYIPKKFKTILNRYRFIDSWFWCRYGINPYNGCEFACTYCDSRSHKYHLQPDFDHTIYIKTDVGVVLNHRIKHARTPPDVVAIGGTCDAYQPAEARYKNTRQCLDVLLRYNYPVFISTKSTLILRDLDLLSQIAKESWCAIGVTIITLDEKICKFLEPNAPSADERIEVISEVKKDYPEIQVGVNFIPIVPLLCDSDGNMESVVKATKERGANFIFFSTMTMRNNQAKWFMEDTGRRVSGSGREV
jgi:DNA repair photolyase